MHPSVNAKLSSFLKSYEGKVGFMYLDAKGLVTVGIGHLIDPISYAKGIKFQFKGQPGSDGSGAFQAEWQMVKSRQDLKDKGAAAFAPITTLELSDAGIEALVVKAAKSIEDYIKTNASARRFYADFDHWPADAQLGFLGVAWGGIPLPQFGWHKFPEACRTQDWATAAKECKITSPIAVGRNEAHQRMFQNAAQAKANGDDIRVLNWPATLLQKVDIIGER
jgi:GH24 family phage-related lysozyme (muramidase)